MANRSDQPTGREAVLDDVLSVAAHALDELERQRRRLDRGDLHDPLAAIRKAVECLRLADELTRWVADVGTAGLPLTQPPGETSAEWWGTIG